MRERRREPATDPDAWTWKAGGEFRFHLLFDGKPLHDDAMTDVSYLGYSTGQDDFWISKRALDGGSGRFDIIKPGLFALLPSMLGITRIHS